jgi:hypothetical protein
MIKAAGKNSVPTTVGTIGAPEIFDREFEQSEAAAGNHKAVEIECSRRRGAKILDQIERRRDARDPDRSEPSHAKGDAGRMVLVSRAPRDTDMLVGRMK